MALIWGSEESPAPCDPLDRAGRGPIHIPRLVLLITAAIIGLVLGAGVVTVLDVIARTIAG